MMSAPIMASLALLSLGGNTSTQPTTNACFLFEPGKEIYHKPSCKCIAKAENTQPASPQAIREERLKPCIVCFSESERLGTNMKDTRRVNRWGVAADQSMDFAKEEEIPKVRLDELRARAKGQLQWPETHAPYGPHGFRIHKILTSREMLVEAYRGHLWIKGLPTDDLRVGQVVELPQVFRIGRTEKIVRKSRSGGGTSRQRVTKMTLNGPVSRTITRRNPTHTKTEVLGEYRVVRYSSGSKEVRVWPEIAINHLRAGETGRIVDSHETHRDIVLTVQQVIDGSQMMVSGCERRIWVKGVSTSDATRNKKYRFTGIFTVEGTKTYKTVIGGTNTVPVLRFLGLGIDCLRQGAGKPKSKT